MEYLINFAMSFKPFLLSAVVIFSTVYLMARYVGPKESENKIRSKKIAKIVSIVILVVGAVIAATSPSNTYKHNSYDPVAATKKAEMLNTQQGPAPKIESKTLQPKKTDEDREKSFSSMVKYTE